MSSYFATLMGMDRETLVNRIYNDVVLEYCDESNYPHGKAIPYVGWFWRDTDFCGKRIAIGDCGDFIGVMESNKWGYPERMMTESEVETFIAFIDRIHEAREGALKEAALKETWDWFQTLGAGMSE